jgi:hypothetical protein
MGERAKKGWANFIKPSLASHSKDASKGWFIKMF